MKGPDSDWHRIQRRQARDETAWANKAMVEAAAKTTTFHTWRCIAIETGGIKYGTFETDFGGEVQVKCTSYIPSEKESVRVVLYNGDVSMAEVTGPSGFAFGSSAEEEP